MTQIETNVHKMVSRIKRDKSMKDITFVKGFSNTDHPDPLLEYMVAVSTLDTQVGTRFVGDKVGENISGSMYNTSLKFRVYAPKNAGGDGLTALCYELCEAIKRSDTLKVLQDIKTSGIAFDDNAKTVYRDVVCELSFCLYEEAVK